MEIKEIKEIAEEIKKGKKGKEIKNKKKIGRPKGELNATCIDCKEDFHNPPNKIGKLIRCPKCRSGKQGTSIHGKKYSDKCPLCGGLKSLQGEICNNCRKDVMNFAKETIVKRKGE